MLGGGRKLKNTGTASWEGQYVLADWLTRHPWLGSGSSGGCATAAAHRTSAAAAAAAATSPQQLLATWLPPQWQTPAAVTAAARANTSTATADGDGRRSSCWQGKVAVELGCGLGLVSIVAGRLGCRETVATDGDDVVLRLLERNIASGADEHATDANCCQFQHWLNKARRAGRLGVCLLKAGRVSAAGGGRRPWPAMCQAPLG